MLKAWGAGVEERCAGLADGEFKRVQGELEESGTEGDRWITVGGVTFQAREVFGMFFEPLVTFNIGSRGSFWDKQF